MDSKYKQFTQEADFEARPEIVREAVRDFAGNWLTDWKIWETSEGLESTGEIAGRPATAKFRLEPTAGGAKLTVALQVEQPATQESTRADSGGDYDEQIRKWLQALPWWVQQKQAAAIQSAGQHGKAVPSQPWYRRRFRVGEIFMACVVIFSLLSVTLLAFSALIGLLTGVLFLPGKRNPNPPPIQGWPARVVSVLILAFYGWLVSTIWKLRKRSQRSRPLPPP